MFFFNTLFGKKQDNTLSDSFEKAVKLRQVWRGCCVFSHQLLAVLVHLAHTAVKWKTNFLILDVGDKLVNTDDTAFMKYEKKFRQKAVSIMYTVFSFKKKKSTISTSIANTPLIISNIKAGR